MIIRVICVLVQILVLYLLQTSVFTSIPLAGVVPNLLLILVCAVAFMRGRTPALLTGLASGLMLDCCFGSLVGVYALIYMSIGYLAGHSHVIYDCEDYTLPFVITAGSQFLYSLIYFVFFYLLQGKINLGYYLVRYTIPSVIYTLLLTLVLYKPLNSLNMFLMRFDRE